MKARLASLLVALAVLFTAVRAGAQNVDIKASVDRTIVEVGETFAYSLQATSDDDTAFDDPKPGNVMGLKIDHGAMGPIQRVMIVNGQMTRTQGITTTWTMHAERTGSFNLGPASVLAGGKRRNAQIVGITVVPRGQGRRAVDPFGGGGGSAFDPWKGIFDFNGDDRQRREAAPTADPKLNLDVERAPMAFLHATVDKTNVVVGEQVTMHVYLYEDPYQRRERARDIHEPPAPDFLKKSLQPNETDEVTLGTATVGGRAWTVRLLRKDALFPLKTGRLAIDPMSLTLPRHGGLRESERLTVDVTEPPVKGRPPGYALGDVGDFALTTTVTPRAIEQDGAVGVTIELRGTGNLPSQLRVPTVQGVEWLEPQTTDKLGGQAQDRFGGTRTFNYVVRVHRAGAIDLGQVDLPFFDPTSRSYRTANASLGIVQVAPGKGSVAAAKDDVDLPLKKMPSVRTQLEGRREGTTLADRPTTWALLFAAPLACLVGVGGLGLARRVRARRADREPTNDELAKKRTEEAKRACKGDDAKGAFGAISRAIDAVVLAKTGLSLRGAAGDAVVGELVERGVAEDTAKSLVALRRRCEDGRFAPEDVPVADAAKTWNEARALLDGIDERDGDDG